MKRCLYTLVVVGILVAAAIGVPLHSGAQDDDPDAAIAALETRVAALETAVADLQTETAEASEDAQASPEARSGAAEAEFDTVLFEADADEGLKEWAGEGWTFREGVLHYDGSGNSWRLAPDDLGNLTDYAVEAEIQLGAGAGCQNSYGIMVRAQRPEAHWVGYACTRGEVTAWLGRPEGGNWLDYQDFAVDDTWQTYRVEVRGDTIRLLVDGLLLLDTTDNLLVSDPGGQVGVWSNEAEINIRRFTVLTPSGRP